MGAGARARRLSGADAQGAHRRVLSRLHAAAAVRPERVLSAVRHPQRAVHRRRQHRRAGTQAYEFQRLHGMGEALYEEVVGGGKLGAAVPHLCAGRAARGPASPISCGDCWRTAPTPRSSTGWPTRKRRSRTSSAIRSRRSRPRRSAGSRRGCCRGRTRSSRPSASTAAAWRWIEPTVRAGAARRDRCASSKAPFAAAPIVDGKALTGGGPRRLVLCPHDRRQRIGTVRAADAATIDAAIERARDGGARLGPAGRPGARRDPRQGRRPLRARPRAADGGDGARGRQDAGERARRRARGDRLPALLRGRGAAAVRGPVSLKGPTGETNTLELRGPRPVRVHLARGTSRWRSSPARWRPRWRPAIPVLAKPAEQTPIVAFLATRAAARGGRAARRAAAAARRRRGRRRAGEGPARRGRRLHRLQRHRLGDPAARLPSGAAPSCRSSPRPAASMP